MIVNTLLSYIKSAYHHIVLHHPKRALLALLLVLGFFSYHSQFFTLDASSDSLFLEDDRDLKDYQQIVKRYQVSDFLIITFSPKAELFSATTIQQISHLRSELLALDQVESVISLVDVPLVKQVEGSLADIAKNIRVITADDVDLIKAREEVLASPIYSGLLVSDDAKATALQLNLKRSADFFRVQDKRNTLRNQQSGVSADQTAMEDIEKQYLKLKKQLTKENHQTIVDVRNIMQGYQQYGTLHLGGLSMIADDMVSFIKNDLITFSLGIFIFMMVNLSIIFRQKRWVILALLNCTYASFIMVGLLGYIGWQVTVISSNFISLMLILTMSMNIHLIVRYRQLAADFPNNSQFELVSETVSKMIMPCLYTVLTTIIAFSSLVISGIKPVIDFGWMMTIGLAVILITTFISLPAILLMLPKLNSTASTQSFMFTRYLANLSDKHGFKVILLAAIIAMVSLYGITRLQVENSFINYFHENTEIYQGLKLIDDSLGGTIPLDIIIKFDEKSPPSIANSNEPDDELDDEWDEDIADIGNLLEAFDEPQDTWITPSRVTTIKTVHDYIDGLAAVGKVLSLASMVRIGEDINQAKFDAFELAVLEKRMPEVLHQSAIAPYINMATNEARINLRVKDSLDGLRRNELLQRIRYDLANSLGLHDNQAKVVGVLVLYNNMLQSLFDSQILTLGMVMIGILIMLFILFRSLLLAVIGIIPNVLAALFILGLMGLFAIPLDMMTITIAAITIGIAVDNSIHYIYRFREEFARTEDYVATMYCCHMNIGKAVFYTASTIIVGFSILMLSNFVPTIYFGVLTALAMLIALLGSLTLLPCLILLCRPFSTTRQAE